MCLHVYPSVFEAKYKTLDKTLVGRVKTVTDNFANSDMLELMQGFETYLTDKMINFRGIIGGEKTAERAYELLKIIAEDDPDKSNILEGQDEKVWIRPEKVDHLFVVKPCDYYAQELGPSVFIPLNYNEKVLDEKDHAHDKAEMQFYLEYFR